MVRRGTRTRFERCLSGDVKIGVTRDVVHSGGSSLGRAIDFGIVTRSCSYRAFIVFSNEIRPVGQRICSWNGAVKMLPKRRRGTRKKETVTRRKGIFNLLTLPLPGIKASVTLSELFPPI